MDDVAAVDVLDNHNELENPRFHQTLIKIFAFLLHLLDEKLQILAFAVVHDENKFVVLDKIFVEPNYVHVLQLLQNFQLRSNPTYLFSRYFKIDFAEGNVLGCVELRLGVFLAQ